jgi:hypothetical protein
MAGYIGSKAAVVSSGVERKKTYAITTSTTSLTGLNYTVGKVHVYQNGVRLLDGTDYTATNGTSITLTVAAQSGDNVVVVSQASFQLSEHYTSAEADAEFVTKAGDTMSGNLDVTGTVTSDGLVSVINSDTQGKFSGWSVIGANGASGAIELGQTPAYQGVISYAADANTRMLFDNTYNADAATFEWRTNTAATAKTHMKITGGGDISFYEDTGTTAKFFWDASTERLGIGTSSPASKLDINQGSAYGPGNGLRLTNVVGNRWDVSLDALSMELGFAYNGSNRITVTNGGNVGIGTVTPTRQLDVSKAGTAYIRASDTANSVNMEMLAASSGGWLGTQTNHSLNFQTNNTERMRIDSSGKVGIGTDSPVTNLDVVTTAAGTKARIRSNTTNAPTAGLELCRGTTSTFGADNYTDFLIENVNGGNLAFKSGINGTTSERMRIDSSGNLLVNTTSVSVVSNGGFAVKPQTGNGTRLDISNAGESMLIGRTGSDGQVILFYRGGSGVGNIAITGSSTSYNTSSDYRLKENVVDLTGASARVNQLDVKRFNFIADDTNTLVDGFLAHEVATVVPEAITGTKDAMKDEEYEVTPAILDDDGNVTTEAVMGTRSVPDYQGIDQSKLVPLLTAALQEALTEIASLKTRVEALEA